VQVLCLLLLSCKCLDQPGCEGCGDRAQERNPAKHQPEGHHTSDACYWIVVAVADGRHSGDRPPDRVAEVADVGVGARPLDIKYGSQYVAIQQEIDQLWQRLITNNPDVLLAVLSHAFQNGSAHAAPLGVSDAAAQLALLAPDLAALPERHPTTTAAGNLSLKKFTKGEMAELYKQFLAGLVLASAKEALAVARGVTDIRILALRSTPADAYGNVRLEAILATRISRAAMNGVQWTKADALTILDQISSELVTRIAGPSKAFAPLDLKTEPEIAHLIDVVTPG
jgi:hypothetical protein